MLIRYKGLNLGDGGDYIVTALEGWESRPETTNGSMPRPQSLGSWVGGLGSQKRVITLDLDILGSAENGWKTTVPKRNLRAVMGLDEEESELLVNLEDGSPPEVANVRVTSFNMPTRSSYDYRAQAFIEFTATDPRKYSNSFYHATTGLPTKSRAVNYPIAYGAFAGELGAATRGEAKLENLGNAMAPAIFKVTGPSPAPVITLTYPNGKQKRTQFNTPLAAGEVLEAHTDTGIVTVSGATRSGQTSGALVTQLEIPPGLSTVTLGGTGSDETSLTVSWRDATL